MEDSMMNVTMSMEEYEELKRQAEMYTSIKHYVEDRVKGFRMDKWAAPKVLKALSKSIENKGDNTFIDHLYRELCWVYTGK